MPNILNEEDDLNVGSVVDELLKKYNLKETTDVLRDKITKNINTNKTIVRHIAKDFAMGVITEKNMYDTLLKNLQTPPDVTQKIIDEIKITLAPLIKKVEENRPKDEEEQTNKKVNSEPAVPPRKPTKIKKTPQPEQIIKSTVQVNRKKGPDSYREPIE